MTRRSCLRSFFVEFANLRKQLTFREATTAFTAKRRLRNERKNFMLVEAFHSMIGWCKFLICFHCQIGVFFSQTLFLGAISAGVAKCRLFSQAKRRMDAFVLVHQLGRREVSWKQAITISWTLCSIYIHWHLTEDFIWHPLVPFHCRQSMLLVKQESQRQ